MVLHVKSFTQLVSAMVIYQRIVFYVPEQNTLIVVCSDEWRPMPRGHTYKVTLDDTERVEKLCEEVIQTLVVG